MHAHVVLHVGLLNEALATNAALVRTIPSVNALMACQQGVVGCRVATEAALEQTTAVALL